MPWIIYEIVVNVRDCRMHQHISPTSWKFFLFDSQVQYLYQLDIHILEFE